MLNFPSTTLAKLVNLMSQWILLHGFDVDVIYKYKHYYLHSTVLTITIGKKQ